jgi:hypothetical protein
VGLLAGIASAADYSGRYEGSNLSVTLTPQAGQYAGEIQLGQQRFPAQAHEDADRLAGTFTSDGGQFEFVASFQGDALVLSSGGNTYTLHRVGMQGQPFATPQAGSADANALNSYDVVNQSQYGKAESRTFAANTTPRAALQTVFPELAQFFGARPAILGAYEDEKDHKSIGVSFSAQLNGQPVKGFASAKEENQATSVLVVYCQANAPQGEVGRLMKRPIPTGAPVRKNDDGVITDEDSFAIKDAAGQVQLRQYNFPDNTGSIGIAQGWTTNAQTLGGATITGPAGQTIVIGFGAEVATPDSQVVQLQQQMNAGRIRMGAPPLPPIQMLIAPFSPDPAQALKNLSQAINVWCQQHNQPTATLDRIVQVKKIQPMIPGATAALIIFDLTKNEQGKRTPLRSLIQLECYLVNGSRDTWAFYSTQMSGPPQTFRQDLPVMLAQTMSLKENAAVIAENTRQQIDAQNARFKALQQANKTLTDAYEQ